MDSDYTLTAVEEGSIKVGEMYQVEFGSLEYPGEYELF
jgi:hypothetical protein